MVIEWTRAGLLSWLHILQDILYREIINCQLFFVFSTVVSWCMVATHIKKVKHSMLCVTGEVVCI